MEGAVCNYQKFGFCKYKDLCKNHHLKETCKNLSACVNSKSCQKRHPRVCRKQAIEGVCRFGAACAYHHQEENNNAEINVKVDELEKTVKEMAEKKDELEVKLKDMESKYVEVVKTKEAAIKTVDFKKVLNQKSTPKDQTENKSKPKDVVFKFGALARKAATEEIKYQEQEKSVKSFKCELCDYRSEKNAHLKKHITSKHSVHKCKVCQKEFKNSMDLVSHVAKEHLEDEEALNVQSTSTPNSDIGGKHTSFVFSESMLDEFI